MCVAGLLAASNWAGRRALARWYAAGTAVWVEAVVLAVAPAVEAAGTTAAAAEADGARQNAAATPASVGAAAAAEAACGSRTREGLL